MAITYKIDARQNVVYVIVKDTFTGQEILAVFKSVLKDPQFSPQFKLLSDCRDIEVAVTPEQVKLMAGFIKQNLENFRLSKWAFVVSLTVSYGMIRMFSSILEPLEIAVEPFWSYEEAQKWLDVE